MTTVYIFEHSDGSQYQCDMIDFYCLEKAVEFITKFNSFINKEGGYWLEARMDYVK